jgi:hypothetical protein
MAETEAGTQGATGSLRSAFITFGLVYLALSAVATAILFAIDANGGGGLSMGVLVAAIALAARSYVSENRRAMQRREQLRFALVCLAILLFITLLQLSVLLPFIVSKEDMPQLLAEVQAWLADNRGLVAIIFAIVVVLHFGVLYFTSGWFSRLFAKRLADTGRI